jgi:hypothetical protein
MGLTDRNAPFLRAFHDREHPACKAMEASQQFGWELNDQFEMVGVHPEKMSPELRDLAFRFGLSRMSRGKLSPELRHILSRF